MPIHSARIAWTATIERLGPISARLAKFASLRNEITGAYEHYGLELRYGSALAEYTLRTSHQETFAAWMQMDYESRRQDVINYLQSIDVEMQIVLANWRTNPPFKSWIPSRSTSKDRKLFESELVKITQSLARTRTKDHKKDPAGQHPSYFLDLFAGFFAQIL